MVEVRTISSKPPVKNLSHLSWLTANWLVGGNWLPFLAFSQKYWVSIIIPIDEVIFFRGVAQPPTSWKWLINRSTVPRAEVCYPPVQQRRKVNDSFAGCAISAVATRFRVSAWDQGFFVVDRHAVLWAPDRMLLMFDAKVNGNIDTSIRNIILVC